MQMIDLSGVKDFNAARFLIYWLVATVIAILVAYNICLLYTSPSPRD